MKNKTLKNKKNKNKTLKNKKISKKTKNGGGIQEIMQELITNTTNVYQISNTEFYLLMKNKGLLDNISFNNYEFELQQLHGWLYNKISSINHSKIENFFRNTVEKFRTNDILIISDNEDNYGLVFQIKEQEIENNQITIVFKFIHSYSIPVDKQRELLNFKKTKFYPLATSKKKLKFYKDDTSLKIPKFLEESGIHGERNKKFLKEKEMNSLTKLMKKSKSSYNLLELQNN